MQEQTLVLIKPDAISYMQQILAYFKLAGFLMAGFHKYASVCAETVERHYGKIFAQHPEFREPVIAYITSGKVTAFVFERENDTAEARKLIGPLENAPKGTVRGDFPSDKLHSLVHASDSVEAALEEISIWFENATPAKPAREEGDTTYASKRRAFMNSREERNRFFALAIVRQQQGEKVEAIRCAHACLDLCKLDKTIEDVAAGQVMRVDNVDVCLQDYLHEDTALQRFRDIGITI